MNNLAAVQAAMREQRVDAWLLYDFRGSNSIFAQLIPGQRSTTRRVVLLIPGSGEPLLLVHGLDRQQFNGVELAKEGYLGWRDLHAWLASRLAGCGRVAMEYSPGCTLPVVSMADAGTVELVRSLGVEVVSSANLIQTCVATWSASAIEQHALASRKVDAIKDAAFAYIGQKLRGGSAVHEIEVQRVMHERFRAEGLEWPDGPIVAVNAHSGDPHYEPTEASSAPIRAGDWVLIDLWARVPGDENIFSDVTWVGYCGSRVPEKQQRVFETVRAARDAAVQRAREAWSRREAVQGWQLDDAARTTIEAAGFGAFVKHRTGHSLSPGPKVHGLGMNLDNLETRDTREMLPGIGFTVEPGIYLPEFGVRLEINVFVDPEKGPTITSNVQRDVIQIAT